MFLIEKRRRNNIMYDEDFIKAAFKKKLAFQTLF